MHPRVVLALAGVVVAAGCGSSSSNPLPGAGATLEKLAEASGQKTVALTPGTGDFAPGAIRFSFLVVGDDGELVLEPTADVWIAQGYKQRPFQHTVARAQRVGVPGVSADTPDVPSIYVAHVRAPKAGTYWILATPEGSGVGGLGSITVRPHAYSVGVGAKAPPSKTPTLATTHGKLAPLTTSTHPDRRLYTTSIARAVADHLPFVVAFATPKFCTSRTCGPVVDVVSRVRKLVGDERVRFIHAEVYEDNDPSKPYNTWMGEWGLRSEPWIFLVDRKGRVVAKFEGAVSVEELRAAVKSKLGA